MALLAALTAASAADTLQRIQKQGVLKWGADAEGGAPYVFPDPDYLEHLIGFEVELVAEESSPLGPHEKGRTVRVALRRVDGRDWPRRAKCQALRTYDPSVLLRFRIP